ncbi:unnamed protein product [Durusdinium trenchii]|uniref:Ubiquitin-like domain-containing protein n=1 Tax=Durusdinium trenchii TaxID=1381693 RepID=A0ABP0LJ10_9DINO
MVLVKVLFVSGRQLLVSTEEETIGQLVLRICEKLPQRPEGVLRLCYDGAPLKPSSSLRDAGIRDGDTLTAVLHDAFLVANRRSFLLGGASAGASLLRSWDTSSSSSSSSSPPDVTEVLEIQSTPFAFSAVKADGSVVTWGRAEEGGDSAHVQEQLEQVTQIQATEHSFAALRADGTVVSWGDADFGGDSSHVQAQLHGVRCIQRTSRAFAALKIDGTVAVWGDPHAGGKVNESVQEQLQNVKEIQATHSAFAAVVRSPCGPGTVVAWGNPGAGGDASEVQEELKQVVALQSSEGAFVALREDGTLIAWGHPNLGGCLTSDVQARFSSTDGSGSGSSVGAVQASEGAFAALLENGAVITWGLAHFGGDCTQVKDQLFGVMALQSSSKAFAAIRRDGRVVAWGAHVRVAVLEKLKMSFGA